MELEGASSSSNSSLSIHRCSNASVHLKTTASASNPDRKAKRRLNNQLRKLKRKRSEEDTKAKANKTGALDSISAKTKKRQDKNLRHLRCLWTVEIMAGRWGKRVCQRFFARSLLFREDDLAISDRTVVMSDFLRSCKDVQKRRYILCAKSALAYYNKQNPSAEFELVETMNCCGVSVGETWFHVNFVAKPKSALTNVSLKVFFAELNRTCIPEMNHDQPFLEGGKVPICTCCVVDPQLSEVTTNCKMCIRREVFHPVGAVPNAWKTGGTIFRRF